MGRQNTEIRIGMLGMGLMGTVHSRALIDAATRFEDLAGLQPRLVACADESADHLNRARALFGFERATTNWRDVVDADDIDLVMICSPNWTHVEFRERRCPRP